MKVRIRFSKYGPLKFIGHLDVMRYFQKAFRRSNIPIAYSEGFSPHQIMSFAAPLSVGNTSEGEYLDIELTGPEGETAEDPAAREEELKRNLQAAMVEGIDILRVRLLPDEEKNAMASVAAASYLIAFRQDIRLPEGWQEKLEAFHAQENIPVLKKTKKGEKEIDLKESVYALEIRKKICAKEALPDGVFMLLNASSGGNIKPSFVLERFFETLGYELPAYALMVHRLELYKRLEGPQESQAGRLVPLIWEK